MVRAEHGGLGPVGPALADFWAPILFRPEKNAGAYAVQFLTVRRGAWARIALSTPYKTPTFGKSHGGITVYGRWLGGVPLIQF